MDYTEVMINAVTISEVFADVCGEARYFTMELLNHRQENGIPMEKEEIVAFFSKIFDTLWEKRMSVGKGN